MCSRNSHRPPQVPSFFNLISITLRQSSRRQAFQTPVPPRIHSGRGLHAREGWARASSTTCQCHCPFLAMGSSPQRLGSRPGLAGPTPAKAACTCLWTPCGYLLPLHGSLLPFCIKHIMKQTHLLPKLVFWERSSLLVSCLLSGSSPVSLSTADPGPASGLLTGDGRHRGGINHKRRIYSVPLSRCTVILKEEGSQVERSWSQRKLINLPETIRVF